ncbi:hypothetical protein BpHYR1_034429 [Brachionus plicatilis]|uniref:Uncharacterized protein n=1 Tax=Brachionus plicatilis TaxID=10195 RepID=A0A3M7TAP6_BRAPC|nr:hypothetical protein BpHYR1_034429 [Brachionus plicatilis]
MHSNFHFGKKWPFLVYHVGQVENHAARFGIFPQNLAYLDPLFDIEIYKLGMVCKCKVSSFFKEILFIYGNKPSFHPNFIYFLGLNIKHYYQMTEMINLKKQNIILLNDFLKICSVC